MNMKRIAAVGLIFALACAGWWLLGMATTVRSTDTLRRLGAAVEHLWGVPLVQRAPELAVAVPGSDQVRWMLPTRTDITVDLRTDYRKKGLIWYPTYICTFDGQYTLTNLETVAQKIRLHVSFPATGGTYDNFVITIDGTPLQTPVNTQEGIREIVTLAPGASMVFRVAYRTRGLRDWRYQVDPHAGRVRDLNVLVRTDFADVDYTEGSLSPMTAERTADGAQLIWQAQDLITAQDIGIVIPERVNPGPLTSRITFFAPVCLLFFFILVAAINVLYRVPIHPMHYLFVAAGFYAFHLLLAYMVGLINIHLAFAIAAIVSVALVTSYLSAALRGRFPWKLAAAGQMFYLVLFSYSFFFKGITGLTIAIGSVITLAILMRVTARTDWTTVFVVPPRATPTVPPPLQAESTQRRD